jgi:hypothetical protein
MLGGCLVRVCEERACEGCEERACEGCEERECNLHCLCHGCEVRLPVQQPSHDIVGAPHAHALALCTALCVAVTLAAGASVGCLCGLAQGCEGAEAVFARPEALGGLCGTCDRLEPDMRRVIRLELTNAQHVASMYAMLCVRVCVCVCVLPKARCPRGTLGGAHLKVVIVSKHVIIVK